MLVGQRPKKRPGIRCSKCDKILPLHPPRPAETSVNWICTTCGTKHNAVLNRSDALESLQHVRPERIEFDESNLGRPPEAIVEFVTKMMRTECKRNDNRGAQRRAVVVPVPLIQLDEGLSPTGNVHMAVTRDISSSGISLVSTRAANSPFLAVELSASYDETIQIVMRVIRCRPLRCFYEIAGPFFTVAQDGSGEEAASAEEPQNSQAKDTPEASFENAFIMSKGLPEQSG